MVSSWTVALLFQQLNRYAEVLARAGRDGEAAELSALAAAMRADFNRHLVRDGTVAGYALFDDGGVGARTPAASERHPDRPPLFAAADDPQHHRRAVHRGAGAAPPSASSATTCCSRTACG